MGQCKPSCPPFTFPTLLKLCNRSFEQVSETPQLSCFGCTVPFPEVCTISRAYACRPTDESSSRVDRQRPMKLVLPISTEAYHPQADTGMSGDQTGGLCRTHLFTCVADVPNAKRTIAWTVTCCKSSRLLAIGLPGRLLIVHTRQRTLQHTRCATFLSRMCRRVGVRSELVNMARLWYGKVG